jgi:CBS domain containing-hemolysin-like protein
VLSDGRIRLPGALRLDLAAPALGGVWRPSSETVGARVAAAAGRPVEPGDRIEVDGAEVEIEATEGSSITSVIVALPDRKPAG